MFAFLTFEPLKLFGFGQADAASDSADTGSIDTISIARGQLRPSSETDLIVVFRDWATPPPGFEAKLQATNAAIVDRSKVPGAFLVETNLTEGDLQKSLVAQGYDVVVQKNEMLKQQLIPTDTYYHGVSSGFSEVDYATNAFMNLGWDLTFPFGTRARLAIIDGGIDYNHPDLNDVMWPAPAPYIHGYNFYNDNYDPMDNSADSHGTFMAGVAGGEVNNGAGVAGVARNYPGWAGIAIQAFKTCGYSLAGFWQCPEWDLGDALTWAAGLDPFYRPSVIVFAFLKIADSDYYIDQGVVNAYNAGILLVGAAGNSWPNCGTGGVMYPAKKAEVVAVSAVTHVNDIATWSCRGAAIDMAAAGGESIVSTFRNGGYGTGHGTSFAAPMVGGAAAAIKSRNPSYTRDQLRNALQNFATQRAGDAVPSNEYGYGIVNAYQSVLNGPNDAGSGTDASSAGCSTGLTISPNTGTLTGYVNGGSDLWDYYRFSATSGQVIYLSLSPPTRVDHDLYLYDASCAYRTSSTRGPSLPDYLIFTADQTGNWGIGIKRYAGASTYHMIVRTISPQVTVHKSQSNLVSSHQATLNSLEIRGPSSIVVGSTLEVRMTFTPVQGNLLFPTWGFAVFGRDPNNANKDFGHTTWNYFAVGGVNYQVRASIVVNLAGWWYFGATYFIAGIYDPTWYAYSALCISVAASPCPP